MANNSPKKGGAPKGNSNATKNRIWTLAIQKALRKRSKSDQLEELENIADALIKNCLEGDLPSMQELGNRLEGKPVQIIEGGGEDGSLTLSLIVKYAGTDSSPPEET